MIESGTEVRILPQARYHIGPNYKLVNMGFEVLIDPTKRHTLEGPWVVMGYSTKHNGRYQLKYHASKYRVSVPYNWVEAIN